MKKFLWIPRETLMERKIYRMTDCRNTGWILASKHIQAHFSTYNLKHYIRWRKSLFFQEFVNDQDIVA